MQTLSYGYLKPQTGDAGSIWFPALEQDLIQLNEHDHDGINSAPLATGAVLSTNQAILASNWVSVGGGTFRQAITLPAGLIWGMMWVNFLLAASGNQVYPVVEKISSTSYYVYTNNNTLDYTAVYVS